MVAITSHENKLRREFLALLPELKRRVRLTFRNLRAEARGEIVSEGIAVAFATWLSARRRRRAISRGTRRVSFDELQTIPAPPPTATWHPVSHGRVLDSALRAIESGGYQVDRMDLGVSRDDARFFGVLDLTSTIVEGVTLAVGVRNSIDKSLPAGLAVGDRVLVCDNLAFSAQIVVMRKHTSRILLELDGKMAEAIGRLGAFQEQAAARIRLLQGTAVNDDQVHDLVIRAVDERAIGWRDVPKVLQAWREPPHEEFQPRTAWSLANAFTEVAKGRFERNPTMAPAGTIQLNRLFERALPN